MNDLRFDQEAADAAAHVQLKRSAVGDKFEDYPAGAPETWQRIPHVGLHTVPLPDTVVYPTTVTMPADRLNPADLRTVPPPNLRSPDARTLDCRTFDQQVIAELVRIVDALQAVVLRLEVLEEGTDKLANALWVMMQEWKTAQQMDAREGG